MCAWGKYKKLGNKGGRAMLHGDCDAEAGGTDAGGPSAPTAGQRAEPEAS